MRFVGDDEQNILRRRLKNHSSMGSHAEKILNAKLREGLWEAIQDSEIVDPEDIDSIRFQKLLVRGFKHFDLDERATIEWYLDGEISASPAADRDLMGSKQEFKSAHEFHMDRYPTVSDAADFYRSELDEEYIGKLDEGTFRYIREYYETHESIPYRDLYLSNLDIDTVLMQAKSRVSSGKDLTKDVINDFSKVCRRLNQELLMHEEFTGTLEYVDAFEAGGENLLKQILHQKPENAAKLISEYDNFYYYGLWRIVARIISYHQVTGNSALDQKAQRKEELSSAREEFRERYEGLANWMADYEIELPQLPDNLPDISIDNDGVVESAPDLNGSDDELDGGLGYEDVAGNANLADAPSEIDINELVTNDDPDSPLSEMIIDERSES